MNMHSSWLCLALVLLVASSRSVRSDETDEELGKDIEGGEEKGPKTIGGEDEEFGDLGTGEEDEGMELPGEGMELPGEGMELPDDDDEAPPAADTKPIAPLDYTTPMPDGFYYLAEPFLDTSGIGRRWHLSTAKKTGVDEDIAKYNGEWMIGLPRKIALKNDYGLIVKTKARHHAIAAKLDRPVQFDGKPLIVQYEVKYEEGQECGGGYMKLLSKGAEKDLKNFQDKTPYTIMFGPDKCGMTSKVHFIIRYENPKNHTITEHHAKAGSKSTDEYFGDFKSHLYTLIVNPDNTYQILVDQSEITSGNLLKDLEPSVTPPKEIEDPEERKPEDWDEREKIIDPEARKPDDWDETAPKEIEDTSATKPEDWLEEEEALIADPVAVKPDDWDTEMDGQWEPPKISNPKCEGVSGCGKWTQPMIANPNYKGKWKAPKIPNPDYKGKWTPKKVENPNYFEPDPYRMTAITAIGLELWTMSENIVFDNFLITDDKQIADDFAQKTWVVKSAQENKVSKAEGSKDGFLNSLVSAAEERPWLWAVYILTVLIPIVLISVFCFGGTKDKTALAKKMDVTEPDVVDGEEEEEEEDGGETTEEKRDTSQTRSRKGKAALEEDEEEEGETMGSGDGKRSGEGSPGRRLRPRKQD